MCSSDTKKLIINLVNQLRGTDSEYLCTHVKQVDIWPISIDRQKQIRPQGKHNSQIVIWQNYNYIDKALI